VWKRKFLSHSPLIYGIGHFRHHCATWIGETKHPETDIKLILTHTQSGQTGRYVHSACVERKKEILSTVESYFLGTWKNGS
jgi:hypothetical protein